MPSNEDEKSNVEKIAEAPPPPPLSLGKPEWEDVVASAGYSDPVLDPDDKLIKEAGVQVPHGSDPFYHFSKAIESNPALRTKPVSLLLPSAPIQLSLNLLDVASNGAVDTPSVPTALVVEEANTGKRKLCGGIFGEDSFVAKQTRRTPGGIVITF